MPTNLDQAIAKLSDKGVQNRLRSAMRQATLDALKKEGIELSPAEWGELTARMIAAKADVIRPEGFFGDIADIVRTALPTLVSAFSDRRLKTSFTVKRGKTACALSSSRTLDLPIDGEG
jgi:hypothetical protein